LGRPEFTKTKDEYHEAMVGPANSGIKKPVHVEYIPEVFTTLMDAT
jgi:hypothetical protein